MNDSGLKKRVLIIGPLPPPAGGVPSFTSFILHSDLVNRFELLHLDITRTRGIKEAGKFNFWNVVNLLSQVTKLVRHLRNYRPSLVHLPMTS